MATANEPSWKQAAALQPRLPDKEPGRRPNSRNEARSRAPTHGSERASKLASEDAARLAASQPADKQASQPREKAHEQGNQVAHMRMHSKAMCLGRDDEIQARGLMAPGGICCALSDQFPQKSGRPTDNALRTITGLSPSPPGP